MNTHQTDILDILEETNPDYDGQSNSKFYTSEEHLQSCHEDEKRIDFLIQDMFFEHFFP